MTKRLILAVALVGLTALPAMAQDDLVAEGEQIFRRCAACHKIGEGAKNGVGPSLNGVIGRPAATGEGYKYSDPMSEAGKNGLVWDHANLMAYLLDPKAVVKGTKMAFAGLKSEEDREAVIAYMEANGGSM
jgi:cytochrome c2